MSIFAPFNDIKHFHVTSLVHKTFVNVVAVNAGLSFEASMVNGLFVTTLHMLQQLEMLLTA